MNHTTLSYTLWAIAYKSEHRWQYSRLQIRNLMYTLYKLGLMEVPADLPVYSILRNSIPRR